MDKKPWPAAKKSPLVRWRPIAWRVRSALDASVRLQAGEPAAQIKRSLRMPPKAAEHFMRDIQKFSLDQLKELIEQLAKLELASRGAAGVSEKTAGLQAVLTL